MKRAWFLLRLFLVAVMVIGLDGGSQALVQSVARVPPVQLGVAIVGCGGMVLVYRFFVKRIERREVRELALDDAAARLAGVGALVGGVLFALVVGVVIAAQYAELRGPAQFHGLFAMSSISLVAAVGEELAFRGIVFRVIEQTLGVWVALAVSALLFGALHAFNPGASVASTLAIALEAGVLLGVAYAATGSVWFPIGIHFGWNFAEAGIFGSTISGHVAHGMFTYYSVGPDAWTGGSFGLEGSAPAVVVCLLAAALLAAHRHINRPGT